MKKENKRMAQERRAAERARDAKKKKILHVLGWVVPIVLIVLLIGLIVITNIADKANNAVDTESTETAIATETTTDTTAEDVPVLNTTEGLVAEDGDTVNIAFTGYLDGEAFNGGSSDSYDLTLGSGAFIDGFEDGVVGHSVGETFDLDLTFPETYSNSDLAGQEVTFTVTINGIYDNE